MANFVSQIPISLLAFGISLAAIAAFEGSAGPSQNLVPKSSGHLGSSSQIGSASHLASGANLIPVTAGDAANACSRYLKTRRQLMDQHLGMQILPVGVKGLVHVGRMIFDTKYRMYDKLLSRHWRYDSERINLLIKFIKQELKDPKLPKELMEEVFVMNLNIIDDILRDLRESPNRTSVSEFVSHFLNQVDEVSFYRLLSLKVLDPEESLKKDKNEALEARRSVLYFVSATADGALEFRPRAKVMDFANELLIKLSLEIGGDELFYAFFHSMTTDEQAKVLNLTHKGQASNQGDFTQLGLLSSENLAKKIEVLRFVTKQRMFTEAFSTALAGSAPDSLRVIEELVHKHDAWYFTNMGMAGYVDEKFLSSLVGAESRDEAKYKTKLGKVIHKLLKHRVIPGLQNPELGGHEFIVMAEEAMVGLGVMLNWLAKKHRDQLNSDLAADVFQALQLAGAASSDGRTQMERVAGYDPEITVDRVTEMAHQYANVALAQNLFEAMRGKPHNIMTLAQLWQPQLVALLQVESAEDVEVFFQTLGVEALENIRALPGN